MTVDPNSVLLEVAITGATQNMKMPTILPGPTMPMHANVTLDPAVRGKNRSTSFSIPIVDGVTEYQINGEVFEAGVVHETLELGTEEEWFLTAADGGHPYHIHINPFQVWQVSGDSVWPPVWRDVVYTPPLDSVRIRSRYTQYTGDFVLHCHILNHEDQGMMQRIRIVAPGGVTEGPDVADTD